MTVSAGDVESLDCWRTHMKESDSRVCGIVRINSNIASLSGE